MCPVALGGLLLVIRERARGARTLLASSGMSLSIPQAIRNAVASEEAAAKFYRALAALDVDSGVKAFLEEMALQEDHHAKSIEEAGKRLVQGELPMYADMEIEASGASAVSGRVEAAPDWKIADTLSLDQAMQLARENEYNASLYYDTVADACPEPEASFFRKLALTEEEHAHKLERMR